MNLASVRGTIVATVKEPKLEGQRLLVIQPLGCGGQPVGRPILATDTVRSGVGDTVVWVRGKEAAFAHRPADVPTDAAVVGIVEAHHMPRGGGPEGAR